MQAGDNWAIGKVLDNLGRDRGWGRREQINFNIDLSVATDQQLDRIINGEDPAVVLATPSNGTARKA